MGYYSDVHIICDKITHDKVLEVLKPDEDRRLRNGDYYIFYNSRKWYDDFQEVRDVEACLSEINDTSDNGRYAIYFIFGEEMGDVEGKSYGTAGEEKIWYEYWPKVTLVGID